MSELEVRSLPITMLIPAPYNPRQSLAPTDPAYRKLLTSLREFGLVEPLIWNAETGHIVGGHLRLRMLHELGYQEVPVSVVHLSPEREKSLNLVLNNQEAQGRYDRVKLAALLEELAELPELELSGFDETTLKLLRFEPPESDPTVEAADQLEISLRMDEATFLKIEGPLNELIREYSLEVHVRRGARA